ncbi:hypothetical protein NM688_g5621 [Phlebia brevispora]|uniref:Uncharacterized protein n=1 Tax=Phlebia brevispora TaxID=194682 RepID=A0ACC1SS88_9APHY|nr:hypothetical protein NM688_g5621 [Phlebia brevispora]
MSTLTFNQRSANASSPYSDPAYIESLIIAFQLNLAANYTFYAVACLVCFEYLVTLKHEVQMLWKGMYRRTSVSWLFFANRYVLLLSVIISITPSSPQVQQRGSQCPLKHHQRDAIDNLCTVFRATCVRAPRSGSLPALRRRPGFSSVSYSLCEELVTLAGGIAHLCANTIVLGTTWLKAYRHHGASSRIGLSRTLFRYGLLYLIIMLLVDSTNIALSYLPTGFQTPISEIAYAMEPILISRFLIDLYLGSHSSAASAGTEMATTETNMDSLSVPAFEQRMVTPMGSALTSSWSVGDEEEAKYSEGGSRGRGVGYESGEPSGGLLDYNGAGSFAP